MEFLGHFRRLTRGQRNTFIACFMGWSLDAFDFFILVFCVSALATHFQQRVSTVAEAFFWTLAMRPVGAFVFGMMADRMGRRPTLMVNIIAYSFFELASAFAPNFTIFLITRALFGIAMGGEWGVGAALAFETLPAEGRGFFSGLLQEGYVVGYLMAALVYGTLFQFIGWRGMFMLGALPAVVVIFILRKVEESPAWVQGRVAAGSKKDPSKDILSHAGIFVFLVVLMFGFNSLSHGTQDVYPTFLQKNLGFGPGAVSFIAIVYNVGALAGGILFGSLSERIGRRRTIVVAALLAIPVIPLWAYSHTVPMLAVGGFLMQFMVQGAWGVIPAHLNELSPPAVRGTLPGFAYQVGNLLASRNGVIQARLAENRYAGSFPPVLAWTVVLVASLVAIVTVSGKERQGADLTSTH
jgi:MFS transporter, SHS family, lactate transporter